MMLDLKEIHKPSTLAEAIHLLQQPGTVPLAGGTALTSEKRRGIHAAVDLSALGLTFIRASGGTVAIGATTTLADLAESPILRAMAGGVLAQAAHHSAASVLRNQATAAGTLISDPGGVLAVALAALDAHVTIVRKDKRTVPIADFFSMREHLLMMALLTEIAVPMGNPRASLQTVSRTPSDKPIVSACAAATIETPASAPNGTIARGIHIALGGVADSAVRASEVERALEGQGLTEQAIQDAVNTLAGANTPLHPRGDFRGSAEYRKEMAAVLTKRAIKELAS